VPKTDVQRLGDMKTAIARDLGMLLLVWQVLAAVKREERDRR
jgi:hypothetical protein